MNDVIIKAVAVVTCALVFYSIAVIREQRRSSLTKWILVFLTVGVILDISSTLLMLLGSTNSPLTVHGVIGYTALLVMLVDAVLMWRHWIKKGAADITHRLHIYTRIAYGWWVVAYIVGAVMSMTL